ncbi:MAG: hypothetical protein RR240_05055 [Burkholderiaceae bacterium]
MAAVEIAAGDHPRAAREWLSRHAAGRRAVIAEGLFAPIDLPPEVSLVRLAPGCVCCIGQLPLRVALLRLVRQQRPEHLLVLLADDAHRDRVRDMLADPRLGLVPARPF